MLYFLIVSMISCTMIQAAQSSVPTSLETKSGSSSLRTASSVSVSVPAINNNDDPQFTPPCTIKDRMVCGIISVFLAAGLGTVSWALCTQAPPPTTFYIMANNCSVQCPQGFNIKTICTPPSSEINTIRDQLLAICPNSSTSLLLREESESRWHIPECTPITEHIINLNKTCKSSSSGNIHENHHKNSVAMRHTRNHNK